MFCPKCGKELIPNAKFCSGCGAPAPQQTAAQPTASQPAPIPPKAPKPKKSGKKVLLYFPAAVVVAAAVLVFFNFTALAARVAPEFTLSRGISKLSAALEKQTETGPVSVLPILAETLKEGSFTFSGELEDPNYGDITSFSGTLFTAKEGKEILLQDLTLAMPYVQTSQISFYLSSDAVAVSSRDLTGSNGWYGFALNRPLAEQNPGYQYVSEWETEELQRQLDIFSDLLQDKGDPTAEALAGDLGKVFHKFLDNAKPDISSQTVSGVNATVMTYRFNTQDIATLVRDEFNVLLKEEYVEYLAGAYIVTSGYGVSDDYLEYWVSGIEESRDAAVSALRNEVSGQIVLSFALTSDGTLIQAACSGELENRYDDNFNFECVISFGSNPAKNGDFAIALKFWDAYENTTEMSLTCTTVNQGKSGMRQTISFVYKDPYYSSGENSLVLMSDWDTSTKKFSVSFTVTDDGETAALFSAGGTLSISAGALDLDLDEISFSEYSYWNGGFAEVLRGSFQLSAKKGSSFRVPDYQNIFESEVAYYLF